jgi:hypothetical protein
LKKSKSDAIDPAAGSHSEPKLKVTAVSPNDPSANADGKGELPPVVPLTARESRCVFCFPLQPPVRLRCIFKYQCFRKQHFILQYLPCSLLKHGIFHALARAHNLTSRDDKMKPFPETPWPLSDPISAHTDPKNLPPKSPLIQKRAPDPLNQRDPQMPSRVSHLRVVRDPNR